MKTKNGSNKEVFQKALSPEEKDLLDRQISQDAKLLWGYGYPEEALKILRGRMPHTRDHVIRFQAALILFTAFKKSAYAKAALERALYYKPSDFRSLELLGDVLLEEGNYEEALKKYKQALKAIEKRPRKNPGKILKRIVTTCLALDRPQEALQAAQKCVTPLDITGQALICMCRLVMNEYDALRDTVEQLNKIAPNSNSSVIWTFRLALQENNAEISEKCKHRIQCRQPRIEHVLLLRAATILGYCTEGDYKTTLDKFLEQEPLQDPENYQITPDMDIESALLPLDKLLITYPPSRRLAKFTASFGKPAAPTTNGATNGVPPTVNGRTQHGPGPSNKLPAPHSVIS